MVSVAANQPVALPDIHTAINGIIKAALTAAEIPCRLEPQGLSRDDGKRPDGVTSMPWRDGR